MMRRSIDSHPAPPKPWYQKLLRECLIILGKIALTIGIVIGIPLALFIWVVSTNYKDTPPLGSEYVFKKHAERQGYAVARGKDPWNRDEYVWQPVCNFAAGGRMTLTKHLLIRQEVKQFTMILNGFYRTGIFIYTEPSTPPPLYLEPEALPVGQGNFNLPWCKSGFQEAVPFTTYLTPPW